MATRTVTEISTRTITVSSTSASSTYRATPQGGILEGLDPSVYNPSNPIITFIIQAGIILIFCRLLHWPLSKLRQPRVIAEVIGGILLGPSVMGRIPGFADKIFPEDSMPNLTLVANLGLLLFLFLVGLEVDLRFLISNWRVALSVGAAGMALPFGLGCAIAWGLYHQFSGSEDTEPIAFGTYLLFVGVAMAITAFPVLCRILTELKLLSTPVGVIVLSAGVGNDVTGWILLALCVALVNAGDGLTALWVLLLCVGYVLFMIFAVRPAFMWVLRKTRSLQDGPSQSVVALTLLIALASAFFTGVIGVHPIFGAFLAGLICPHEGGFAIKVTEKVEDLITALFLPLYFTLSGLSTNLGLLDNGIAWAYTVGIIAIAFFAKVIGGSGAARLNGLVWRECFTIGALMSCKGLVELIVLNIGLQAKILSVRVFTMFVVMALVTTFATTPLTSWLYPPWYQKKLEAWKRGEIDWYTGSAPGGESETDLSDTMTIEKIEAAQLRRLMVYLRLDSMPGLLAFVALFGGANERTLLDSKKETNNTSQVMARKGRPIEVHGIRLLQLTERESSVMQVSEVDEYTENDPVVNTAKAFGRIHNVPFSGEVAVVPESYYADTLTSRAADTSTDLLLLPWSETGTMSEQQTLYSEGTHDKLESRPYNEFIRTVVADAVNNLGIFVNNGFGGSAGPASKRRLTRTVSGMSIRNEPERPFVTITKQGHHIFLPYVGSSDDRVACRFVLQLAKDPHVTVKIVHFKASSEALEDLPPLSPIVTAQPTGSKRSTNSTAHESVPLQERHATFLAAMQNSLPADVAERVSIESVQSSNLLQEILDRAKLEVGRTGSNNAGDLIVAGRNAKSGNESSLGNVGDMLTVNYVDASFLVMQASRR